MTKTRSRGRRNSSPVSLRLTKEELTLLRSRAKGKSVSSYIRSCIFCENTLPNKSETQDDRLSPQIRQKLMAQILSKLGKSGLAQSLEELACAAKIGTLPLTPDVLSEIRSAYAFIHEIRTLLIRALGLRPKDDQQ